LTCKALKDPKYAHPVCQACIKSHMDKYDNFVDENGVVYNDFKIKCDGIPLDYITDQEKAFLPESEHDKIRELFDPVVWAANNVKLPNKLPWFARWYQEIMLRCTAHRRVTRLGRRCLAEGTLVMTPAGSVEIQNLKIGDIVYGYNPDTDKVFKTPVEEVWNQGIQDIVDLQHRKKVIASCTEEHRWHTSHETLDKRKVLRTYQLNKRVGITRKFVQTPMGNIDEPHAYVIGALLGDGCSKERGTKIYLSSEDSVIPSAIAEILNSKFKKAISDNNTWILYNKLGRGNPDNIHCNHYNEWCRDRYAHEKIVDLDTIKTWNRESCLKFLAGLLDTDGSAFVHSKRLFISFSMQAQKVIEAVKYLLLALFQYDATILKDNRDKYKNGPVLEIRISNNLFSKRILKQLNPYIHVERKKWKKQYEEILEYNTNKNRVGAKYNKNKSYKVQAWDISIGTKDNLFLLSNGLATHNTGKTDSIAIHALHFAYMNDHKKVLVVAPYKAQTEEIINRIRDFINTNPALQASVKRDRSSPYYNLELHNGSEIRGFSSGSKSGSEAGQVRGQDSDMIYLDEIDMLTEGDLTAIMAILSTTPNVKLWASGTPTGRRAHFWRWCTKTPTYKEFYHSTSVLPHWKEVEEQIRADYAGNKDGWDHEILAIFGEQAIGIFQHKYVDDSLADYKYGDITRKPTNIYGLGIDWNSDRGTEIVVTGFSPGEGFTVVDAINIPKQGWTQLAGIEAVIKLNAFWRPQFIYTDDPGGGTIHVELLKKYGYDTILAGDSNNPSVNLKKNVHLYDFGSKVEAKDPMTGQTIKKHAKTFLVENAARFFEEQSIRLSKHDIVLRNELANYIVKSRSITGQIVYGVLDEKIGDHRLDAFMLSIIGFKLELSNFAHRPHVIGIGISHGFSRHSGSHEHYDQDQELSERVKRMPESRYNEDDETIVFSRESTMPAKVAVGTVSKVYKHGWDTDEEDKFEFAWRKRKMLRRAKRRNHKPIRSNI
jgi:hypothetical protein